MELAISKLEYEIKELEKMRGFPRVKKRINDYKKAIECLTKNLQNMKCIVAIVIGVILGVIIIEMKNITKKKPVINNEVTSNVKGKYNYHNPSEILIWNAETCEFEPIKQ